MRVNVQNETVDYSFVGTEHFYRSGIQFPLLGYFSTCTNWDSELILRQIRCERVDKQTKTREFNRVELYYLINI